MPIGDRAFEREYQGDWATTKERCSRKTLYEHCPNVAEFLMDGEPICGRCVAPCASELLGRQDMVVIQRLGSLDKKARRLVK